MAFAENLNHLMELNNITNYFIAKELGVSQTSVANWRAGSNSPHKKTRIAIASFFGISLEEIDGPVIIDAILAKKEKPVAESDELLDGELILRLCKLTPDELQKVDAFVQGILASR